KAVLVGQDETTVRARGGEMRYACVRAPQAKPGAGMNILFRMPFLTAARTSARSRSPPTMLLRAADPSVPELSACSEPMFGAMAASSELRSRRGNPVPPPG